MKSKILLTGKNGQLGFELQRSLAPLGDVISFSHHEFDLTDVTAIRNTINLIRPSLIVNPAAYTAVDKAEQDQEKAYAVNATALAVLGEEASKIGACVVHYSTDYVFDGYKCGSYLEMDETNPQNVYGSSKLAGEQALLASGAKSLILRTSWVVGVHGANFAKTILRLAAERERLNIVSDQYGAPTSAALLADVTAHVLRQYLAHRSADFPFGLYHVTSSGDTNWFDYARFVVAAAQKAGRKLKMSADDIYPIAASEYPSPAQRPSNSRLNTQCFQRTFDLCLPHWQEGLCGVLQHIL